MMIVNIKDRFYEKVEWFYDTNTTGKESLDLENKIVITGFYNVKEFQTFNTQQDLQKMSTNWRKAYRNEHN